MDLSSKLNKIDLKGCIFYQGISTSGPTVQKAFFFSKATNEPSTLLADAPDSQLVKIIVNVVGKKSALYFPIIFRDKSKAAFLMTKDSLIRPAINSPLGSLYYYYFDKSEPPVEVLGGLPIDYFNAPTWSPDGAELMFRKNDDVNIVNLLDKSIRFVCKGILPVWNPTDKFMAACVDINKPNIIETINLSTSKKQILKKVKGAVVSLAWSPDGRYLAYAEERFKSIWLNVIDVKSGGSVEVGLLGVSSLTSNIIWSEYSYEKK